MVESNFPHGPSTDKMTPLDWCFGYPSGLAKSRSSRFCVWGPFSIQTFSGRRKQGTFRIRVLAILSDSEKETLPVWCFETLPDSDPSGRGEQGTFRIVVFETLPGWQV